MTAHDNDGNQHGGTQAQLVNVEETVTREARLLRRQEVESQRMATELRLEIGRCLSVVPDPGSRGCHIKSLSPVARRTATRLAQEYEAIRNDPVCSAELPENHMDGDLHHLSRAVGKARRVGAEYKAFDARTNGRDVLALFGQDDSDAENGHHADDDAEPVPDSKDTEVSHG